MSDPSTSLLIDTLEKRWRAYRGELKRCLKEPNEEAIHDLRVATRRMLALVDMLRALSPHARLAKLRTTFKDQLDSLDELRDTQVMLVEVAESLGDLPELAPFQDYLNKREKRLLKSTAKAIKSFETANVRKRLDATRKALSKVENNIDRQAEILRIVDEAYGSTLRRNRNIEPAQSATIHRVRIAFKKFRYMVEIVFPLIPGFPDENFKDMHEYQGLMGAIQDLEIFISSFEEFAGKNISYNPEPVRQYYQQRHSGVIHAYLEDMHQLNTFWRPTAESPFPWEIGQEKNESRPMEAPAEPFPGGEKDENGKQAKPEQEAQK